MIGYLFLGIALIAGATKGFCGKRISGKITTLTDSVLTNTGRMLACTVIGFCFVLLQEGFSALTVTPTTLWISLASGISSALFVISWVFAVKQSAYMMVEVFLLLGTMIPIGFSALFFDESIRGTQAIGILILFIAVYLMSTYNTSVKGKLSLRAMLPLFIAGAANGLADFSQKMFSRFPGTDSVSAFSLYTHIFSAAVLLLAYLLLRFREGSGRQQEKTGNIFRLTWGYILVMSVCLYINAYCKTLAAGYIPSTQLYPLNQGISVILSLFMAAVFFKEKINRKCVMGICLAFAALLLINFF